MKAREAQELMEMAAGAARTSAPMFDREGWEYHNGKPDVVDLVETIATLILMADVPGQVSTGRFTVTREIDDMGQVETNVRLDLGSCYREATEDELPARHPLSDKPMEMVG